MNTQEKYYLQNQEVGETNKKFVFSTAYKKLREALK